tara:strand:+ start:398 stop:625 length:228 start_codon:yes stop_codon:yes gene_type:complete
LQSSFLNGDFVFLATAVMCSLYKRGIWFICQSVLTKYCLHGIVLQYFIEHARLCASLLNIKRYFKVSVLDDVASM